MSAFSSGLQPICAAYAGRLSGPGRCQSFLGTGLRTLKPHIIGECLKRCISFFLVLRGTKFGLNNSDLFVNYFCF